jgi:hypothetical protein
VFWWGNLGERDHLEDPVIGRRIILKLIFRKWDGGYGLNQAGAGEGLVASSCECSNALSGSIRCGEFHA